MTPPLFGNRPSQACDALVVAIATLLALEASTIIGIRDPRFQVAFVVVWVSLAARRVSDRGRSQVREAVFRLDRPRDLVLWVAGVLPWMLLWSAPVGHADYLAAAALPIPTTLRWAGVTVGIASVVAPAIMKRAGRKPSASIGDSEAVVALALLSANWVVGLLAFVSLPIAARLNARRAA
jgi:hypothetical protein